MIILQDKYGVDLIAKEVINALPMRKQKVKCNDCKYDGGLALNLFGTWEYCERRIKTTFQPLPNTIYRKDELNFNNKCPFYKRKFLKLWTVK